MSNKTCVNSPIINVKITVLTTCSLKYQTRNAAINKVPSKSIFARPNVLPSKS